MNEPRRPFERCTGPRGRRADERIDDCEDDVIGIDASASAGSIPVPATFAAGAMIEKIDTSTAVRARGGSGKRESEELLRASHQDR
jgi:hypothetical protein